MSTPQLKTIREFSSRDTPEVYINALLQNYGWELINTTIERPSPDSDGAFKETITFWMGHESDHPTAP
jgi:hypothetical protein